MIKEGEEGGRELKWWFVKYSEPHKCINTNHRLQEPSFSATVAFLKAKSSGVNGAIFILFLFCFVIFFSHGSVLQFDKPMAQAG